MKLGDACQSPVDEGDRADRLPIVFAFAARRRSVRMVRLLFFEFVLISNFFINARNHGRRRYLYAIPRWRPRSGYGAVRPARRRPIRGAARPNTGLPRVPAAAPPPRATGDERDEAPTVRRLRAQPAARADPRSPVRVNSHPSAATNAARRARVSEATDSPTASIARQTAPNVASK